MGHLAGRLHPVLAAVPARGGAYAAAERGRAGEGAVDRADLRGDWHALAVAGAG